MKKNIISMILLAAGCLCASAQEADTKEVFKSHWYVQAQGGFQHTLGEIKWKDLNSGNAQIAFGYQFSKVWGARIALNGWQSKGGIIMHNQEYKYKWNYVAPSVNATFNVTNAIFGYNPKRIVDFSVFAGVGVNLSWNNDQAADVDKAMMAKYEVTPDQVEFMHYLWADNKALPVGQWGVDIDFKVSNRVTIGVEAGWNIISDHYNSKRAYNCDWYFNTLAGLKVALGPTTKTVPVEVPAPIIIEKPVYVHDTLRIEKGIGAEPIRRDIFFTIRNSEVSKSEMPKVEDIAAYLNRYPKAKVTVTGYADKGTGNAELNYNYAKQRAETVAELLIKKFGIKPDRIIVDSKGDTVQPYDINDLNRVSICVAE